MDYVYHCKKNGLDYVYSTEVEFAKPQDAYAWRRGVREYADNYHAEVTAKFEPDETKRLALVGTYCEEALARFNAGDVPGERVAADPKTVAIKQLIATLVSKGFTLEQIAAKLVEPESVLIPADKKRKVA